MARQATSLEEDGDISEFESPPLSQSHWLARQVTSLEEDGHIGEFQSPPPHPVPVSGTFEVFLPAY